MIGGDAAEPAGEFPDALSLLEGLGNVGHPFASVGIGGYPEGPIRVGVPGAISRQKLIRVSARLGLGRSARFLKK